MKTTIKKLKLQGFFAALFALLAFSPALSSAQSCPNINNMLNCTIDVKIEVFSRASSGPFSTTCSRLCNSYNTTLAPGSVTSVICSCAPVCNVRVTVIGINGNPVSSIPVTADYNTSAPGAALPHGCSALSPVPHIYYNGSSVMGTFILN